MIRIALTGSIGMGKSTIAAMFAERGIPLFDADLEVHRLQSEGGALVEPIGRRFPGTVREGRVDRELLGRRVLGEPAELAALEAIVHPAVQRARQRFLTDHAGAPAVLFDIPLLFETGGEKAFDRVILASAPTDIQRSRVLARPGMTAAKLDSILARQMPDSQKRLRSDFIIDTGGTLAETRAQVDSILAGLGLAKGA